MRIDISMDTRDGKAYAKGVYKDGKVTVLRGGKISASYNGNSESILALRKNAEYVDQEGVIIKDCDFSSASAAAQFVNGNISNGMRVWKVRGQTLGEYLKKHLV